MKIGKLVFGEPWSFKADSVGILVPILNKDGGKRAYITIEEAKEKLDIKDTGKIDVVEISSKSTEPVFIRGGTMFEGVGTQSRGSTVSIVIMPQQKEVKVPVKCIHASHPISYGSSFKFAGTAPRGVLMSLNSARANQGEVWSSVQRYSAGKTFPRQGGMDWSIRSDNLVENVREIDRFKGDIDKAIKNIPVLKDQVGVAVLDFNGVVGLELFDSPQSWKAVCKDVFKRYADTITQSMETPLFKLDKEAVKPKIMQFIRDLINSKDEVVFEVDGAKTVMLVSAKVLGEYTTIKNKCIHLLGLRKEKEEKRDTDRIRLREMPVGGNEYDNTWRPVREYDNWRPYRTPQRRYNHTYVTLSSLSHEPKRFTQLSHEVKGSTATLSKKLKNLTYAGMVTKSAEMVDDKVVPMYSLTDTGKSFFEDETKMRKKFNKQI